MIGLDERGAATVDLALRYGDGGEGGADGGGFEGGGRKGEASGQLPAADKALLEVGPLIELVDVDLIGAALVRRQV